MAPAVPLVVHVTEDGAAFAERAADLVVREAAAATAAGRRLSLVLAGGGTPAPVYRLLAGADRRERIAWDETEVFFGDERCVPPDDPGSNARMARETLLDHVPIPPANVHRIRGELPPEEAAREAEADLRATLGESPRPSLVFLGLGEDGHTASLFPDSPALEERERLFVPAAGPPPWPSRVTMTIPALSAAATVVFLVAGEAKAAAAARAVSEVRSSAPRRIPAARVRPSEGTLVWLLDRDAARSLPEGRR